MLDARLYFMTLLTKLVLGTKMVSVDTDCFEGKQLCLKQQPELKAN